MRVYNSIILSSLLLAGIASNLKSFEYRYSESLPEFNARQHLLADAEDATFSSPMPHRGSGRFTTESNPNLVLPQPQLLANNDDKENSNPTPSRGSGRFTTELNPDLDSLQLQLLANNDDKENSNPTPSRGSGRFMESSLNA